jgi:D-alanyl-D-alanine carboxypeptidase (penicillin-binding protein 5/6)
VERAAAPTTPTWRSATARAGGAEVGTVVRGPSARRRRPCILTADIPDPDAWWRLTHPLQLFGLAD